MRRLAIEFRSRLKSCRPLDHSVVPLDRALTAALTSMCLVLTTAPPSSAQECIELPNDAVAWWTFDEETGPVVADSLGTSPGVMNNGAHPDLGQVGNSVCFDGSNDFVSVPDSPLWDLGTKDFSIEFWARFSAPGGGSVGHPGDVFIGNDEGGGTQEKWFFALGGGVLNFHINGPGTGSSFSPQVPFSPTTDQWYHLAVTRQGDLFSIYVDGELGGSSVVAKTIPNANAPLTIGQAENLGYMNGCLDEMALYHRALQPAELQAIYQAGTSGKCVAPKVIPDEGGNDGTVTVTVTGPGLASSTTLTLTHDSLPAIAASQLALQPNGKTVQATFDLNGAVLGSRDLTIADNTGVFLVLEDAFQVVSPTEQSLWSDITGYDLILAGGEQTFWLTYGNDGNTDAYGAIAMLKIPANVEYKLGDNTDFVSNPEDTYEGALVPRIGPGETRFLPFRIRAPFSGQIGLGTTIATPTAMYDAEPNYLADESPLGSVAAEPGLPSAGAAPGLATSLVSYKSGESGGPGTVHWFSITITYSDGTKKNEDQVGVIGPDGKIMWSLSGQEVQKNDFAKVGTYSVGDAQYEWFHLFGFEPFPPDQMQPYVNGLDGVFAALEGTPHSFNGGVEGSISCLGFLMAALWNGNPPGDFAAVGGGDCPAATCWTTKGLLEYLLEQFGTTPDEFLGTLYPPSILDKFIDWILSIIGSWDPNVKGGSQGAGSENFVTLEEALRYTIRFENDPETASAAAHKVVIGDALDPSLVELSTLRLESVGFSDVVFSPTPGSQSFSADLPIPGVLDRVVHVTALLNPGTATLSWQFQTIDVGTGLPPENPLAGFLPPNDSPPEGEGFVLFTVQPRTDLATGTLVPNDASITFDFNDPIITPVWMNTIDADAPVSSIESLVESTDCPLVELWMSSSDVGSGVAEVTIFVAADGGPLEPWATTSEPLLTFPGEPGHTYGFASRAVDLAGNAELVPLVPQATTGILGGLAAIETARNGVPANPDAYAPGIKSGPIIGSVWDPSADNAAFAPDAVANVMLISGAPANIPLGAAGTLLCDMVTPPVLAFICDDPGTPFEVPVPADCGLVGLSLCTQIAAVHPDSSLALTNALDITIGTH